MDVPMVALVVALAISATAAAIWTRAQKRRLDREVLGLAAIFEQFYRGGEATFADMQQAYLRIADATGVEAGALRPDDRFDRELRPDKGWEDDDSMSLFSDELALEAESAGLSVNLEEIATVDDVVRLMKRIRECGAGSPTRPPG